MSNLSRKTEKGLALRSKRQAAARAELKRLADERRVKAGLKPLPEPVKRPSLMRCIKRDEAGNKMKGTYQWFRIDDQGKKHLL